MCQYACILKFCFKKIFESLSYMHWKLPAKISQPPKTEHFLIESLIIVIQVPSTKIWLNPLNITEKTSSGLVYGKKSVLKSSCLSVFDVHLAINFATVFLHCFILLDIPSTIYSHIALSLRQGMDSTTGFPFLTLGKIPWWPFLLFDSVRL